MELVRFPVHRALTRPQMFAGVTYSFFIINAAVTTEIFLITKSFWALPAALAIQGAGYLACLREPRVFEVDPDVEARVGRHLVRLGDRRPVRQQVAHVDPGRLRVGVLNQVEEVDPRVRRALGQVPGRAG